MLVLAPLLVPMPLPMPLRLPLPLVPPFVAGAMASVRFRASSITARTLRSFDSVRRLFGGDAGRCTRWDGEDERGDADAVGEVEGEGEVASAHSVDVSV